MSPTEGLEKAVAFLKEVLIFDDEARYGGIKYI